MKDLKKSEPAQTYTIGHTYTLKTNLHVRVGAGRTYTVKRRSALTADDRKNSISDSVKAILKSGTEVLCQDLIVMHTGSVWMKIPSGWICAMGPNGKTFVH